MRKRLVTAAPLVFMAGLALLSLAWVFGNAPFGSPDETQHYLRAIGIGEGQLIGPKMSFTTAGLTPVEHAWVEQATRGVRVPSGLDPANSDCAAQHPELSAACVSTAVTPRGATELAVAVGNYQPLPYVLPGVAILRARHPVRALFLGRVASLIDTLPFLIAGIAALTLRRRRSGPTLAGAALALTPMVVFLVASVNPSGVEIAAGFALAAGLIRLSDEPTRLGWVLVGVSGFVLAVSRSPAAAWVAALAALFVLWHGPRRTIDLVRAWRLSAALAGGALLAGIALNRWWEAKFGSHVASVVPTLSQAWTATRMFVPLMSREAVGVFGYLNVSMPTWVYWAWEVMTVALLAVALLAADGYRRSVVAATAVALALLPAFQWFFVTERTGYPVQARHLLPVLVVLPILAAEAVRGSERAWAAMARHWSPLLLVPVAALEGLAWWTNAGRAAVGRTGPRWFLSAATWKPPLGWIPWTAAALAGTLLIALAGVLATGLSPSLPRHRRQLSTH